MLPVPCNCECPDSTHGRRRTTVCEEGKPGKRGKRRMRGRNGRLERREREEAGDLIFIGLLVS
jgi:hypothetical protein